MGCRITAKLEDGKVVEIKDYSCNVGKKYAQEELTAPKRMITALMRIRGSHQPLPVKTSQSVEKARIFDCLKEIRHCAVTLPVHSGDVLIPNICGTQADIVATKEIL